MRLLLREISYDGCQLIPRRIEAFGNLREQRVFAELAIDRLGGPNEVVVRREICWLPLRFEFREILPTKRRNFSRSWQSIRDSIRESSLPKEM